MAYADILKKGFHPIYIGDGGFKELFTRVLKSSLYEKDSVFYEYEGDDPSKDPERKEVAISGDTLFHEFIESDYCEHICDFLDLDYDYFAEKAVSKREEIKNAGRLIYPVHHLEYKYDMDSQGQFSFIFEKPIKS